MTTNNWEKRVTLRQYNNNTDLSFLESLYAASRESEMAMTNFTSLEKSQFLSQQFSAQTIHYTTNYCTDDFNIVEVSGEPVGRLFVDYWEKEIRIVDIALMPKYQNTGLGTYLLQQVFNRAKKRQQPVTIHVEHTNPARRLYEKLGFVYKEQTNNIYLLMQWSAY